MRLLRRGLLGALACSTLLLMSAGGAQAAPRYPAVDGWIVDEAEQVPDDVEARIEAELQAFHDRADDEVAIAVVPNMGGASVEDYANDLFNKWGVGDKKRDVGVLLLVAMEERKLRIETGYGAEEFITDIEAKQIIDNYVTPQMRAGDVGAAVDDGQRAIRAALGDTSSGVALPVRDGPPPEKHSTPASVFFSVLPFVLGAIAFSAVFGGRRRRRGGGIWDFPIFIGGGHHHGNYGGFGGGFGGGGGGGDSGGGGSFGGFGGGSSGGGGASGSW